MRLLKTTGLTTALFIFAASGFAQVEESAQPEKNPTPPGTTRQDSRGTEQVWVPAGTFFMGTTEDEIAGMDIPKWAAVEIPCEMPRHEVKLTKGFWIDRYEVTNKDFQAFVEDGGYQKEQHWSPEGREWLRGQSPDSLPVKCVEKEEPDHPRVCVTWFEAEAFAHWRGGRLPYEAEWEFAARGPKSLIFPWGNEFDPKKANVLDSEETTPVGNYPQGASWVGALDMSGNAMEWVQDWLSVDYYEQSQMVDPTGPSEGKRKVEKGGWWGSNIFVSRSAYKHYEDPPTYKDHHIGFRVLTPVE